jgi:Sulfotransferase domain
MRLPSRLRRARFRNRLLRRPLVALRHRGLRPGDAFVVSYPRSGTTWTVFMLRHALTGIPATFGNLNEAVPYLGGHARVSGILADGGRLIRSHETLDLGPRRVVYIVRDPRSVVLSEYRWQLMSGYFDGTLADFVGDFVSGTANPWGAWDRHVECWYAHTARASGPLLVVRYEDLRQDPAAVLSRILGFLGSATSPTRLQAIVDANDLNSMRRSERDTAIPKVREDLEFVGDGGVASWRDQLSGDATARITERFGDVMRRAGYGP